MSVELTDADELKDKDIAFFWGLISEGGEANVGEIREVTEECSAVPELDNSAINYRCRRLGQDGTNTVSGKGFVEVRPGGVRENGQPAPKVVKLVDESIEAEVKRVVEERTTSIGRFDTPEEAFKYLLDDVEGLKSEKKTILSRLGVVESQTESANETVEQLTTEFSSVFTQIRDTILEEHDVDIADAVDEVRIPKNDEDGQADESDEEGEADEQNEEVRVNER